MLSTRVSLHDDTSAPVVDNKTTVTVYDTACGYASSRPVDVLDVRDFEWWAYVRPKGRIAKLNGLGDLTLDDVPEKLKSTLWPKIVCRNNGEYAYVNPVRKNPDRYGWQGHYSLNGHLTHICKTGSRDLCALLVTASKVDPRLQLQESVHAWILYMIDKGPEAVDAWLREVNEKLQFFVSASDPRGRKRKRVM